MKKNGKHICVVGLGHFGAGLARALARHCEVVALDIDIQKVNDIAGDVHRALCLDVREFAALASVVSGDFDEAVVSIGESLEASILCTLHLKRIGVPVIRAKANSADHAQILLSVGAAQIVFPEQETAERLALRMLNPNLLDFIPLAKDYRVTDISAPAVFWGKSLLTLQIRNRFGLFVIAIKRQGTETFVFLPGPDHVIERDDVLVMIGRECEILKMRETPGTINEIADVGHGVARDSRPHVKASPKTVVAKACSGERPANKQEVGTPVPPPPPGDPSDQSTKAGFTDTCAVDAFAGVAAPKGQSVADPVSTRTVAADTSTCSTDKATEKALRKTVVEKPVAGTGPHKCGT